MKDLSLADRRKFLRVTVMSFGWKVAIVSIGLLIEGFFLSSIAKADSFWIERTVGWQWYQDPENTKPEAINVAVSTDPIAAMAVVRHRVQQTLDLAILNPTEENIQRYIALQNQLGERAERFADIWRSVLLKDPALDYSLKHPTNQIAKQIDLDRTRQQEEDQIKQLAKHHGLFFFYRSTCPYCQRFAPIVKHFSMRYGLAVIPITTDGVSLPEFPHSHRDQGQAARLKVTVEPALFTADPQSHRIIPVSFGLLSEDELRQRLLTIVQQTERSEKHS